MNSLYNVCRVVLRLSGVRGKSQSLRELSSEYGRPASLLDIIYTYPDVFTTVFK